MGYTERKKKKRSLGYEGGGMLTIFKSSFVGLGISLGVGLVLWFAAAIVAYSCNDPDGILSALAFCAVYITSLVGGFVSSKVKGEGGLICGVLNGVMLVFVLLLVSVIFDESYSSGYRAIWAFLLRGAVVLMSALGGLIGAYKRPKRRQRRR